MKVKRLLQANSMPYHMVVELVDGRFASFLISPFREIKDADLKALPFYRAAGRNGIEAPGYMYGLYGFEKK